MTALPCYADMSAFSRELNIHQLRALVKQLRDDEVSLLRLPFQVEVETHRATRFAPAEYGMVTIDEDIVREAVDWLIDKHIDELEAKAMELQRARWDAQKEMLP